MIIIDDVTPHRAVKGEGEEREGKAGMRHELSEGTFDERGDVTIDRFSFCPRLHPPRPRYPHEDHPGCVVN